MNPSTSKVLSIFSEALSKPITEVNLLDNEFDHVEWDSVATMIIYARICDEINPSLELETFLSATTIKEVIELSH